MNLKIKLLFIFIKIIQANKNKILLNHKRENFFQFLYTNANKQTYI